MAKKKKKKTTKAAAAPEKKTKAKASPAQKRELVVALSLLKKLKIKHKASATLDEARALLETALDGGNKPSEITV